MISTTDRLGRCPRGVAPEHRDHWLELRSGSNTGKRYGCTLETVWDTFLRWIEPAGDIILCLFSGSHTEASLVGNMQLLSGYLWEEVSMP